MSRIVPVVLCGGSGTRLWPRSRAAKPKPFIPLLGETTLFEETLARCADRERFGPPVVVIGEKHLAVAQEQAAGIAPDARFIVEPCGRNTAPAVALAAHSVARDDIMLVCPSDHFIADTDAFAQAALAAANLARGGWLVCFGIAATSPETGYGYLRRGDALDDGHRVAQFVEKPDLDRALAFIADGGYAWNGGIFALPAGLFLDELAAHRSTMAEHVATAFENAKAQGDRLFPEAEAFAAISGESVDYALMENTDRAAMVDVSMGWSDIGNWDALMSKRGPDADGNVILGPGEIIAASGAMIDSDGPHVTLVGASDTIVVVDGDDILVAARSAVQRVGEASRCRSQ